MRLDLSCGPEQAGAAVPRPALDEALAPLHEPTLPWATLRGRLARDLARLHPRGVDVPAVLARHGARGRPFLLHNGGEATWAAAIQHLDRGEGGLRTLLNGLVAAHPERDALLELADVLEGGWQALDNLCGLVGVRCRPEWIPALELRLREGLHLPRAEALVRLFRDP